MRVFRRRYTLYRVRVTQATDIHRFIRINSSSAVVPAVIRCFAKSIPYIYAGHVGLITHPA